MTNNQIKYLNKDFNEFRKNLINYSKTYFPNVYNDFSDANPGALFIDLSSYIGDVSSFYIDNQIQENFLLYAKEKENLFALSYMFGYRPKISYASNVNVDIFQLIPSTTSASISIPNYVYGLIIPENTSITSTSTNTNFITTDIVDFTDINNTEISFVDSNYFLLKKSVKAISAEIKTTTLSFTSPVKYQTSTITDDNILQILDATDATNKTWYEVPYLAQQSILTTVENPTSGSDGVPYLLSYTKAPRRFVSRFLSDDTLQLEFGAGINVSGSDNLILPTPDNIQLGLIPGISNLLNNYNKASIFYTEEYGLAPSDNITVRYLVGGGIKSNVPSNDLTTINNSSAYFPSGITGGLADQILASLVSNNPSPASGGKGADEIEEIRNNALYAYQSQLRAVTKEDYMVRALSLPSQYGSISKVYVTQDVAREKFPTPTISTIDERNPLSLDMYILSYNSDKNLTNSSTTLKENLIKWINPVRMATDSIDIKDAYYINIGINFDITVIPGLSNNQILTDCITTLKNIFDIDKWQINQPIILSNLYSALLQVPGVQSVVNVQFTNKSGGNYSPYSYDVNGATLNGVIYPSLDPSIFEVRFPDLDIQGRVVTF